MREITTKKAVKLLVKAVKENFEPAELLEIYNELFPQHPATLEEVKEDASQVRKQLVDYMHGRSAEELPDMWSLIFPGSRSVWYNEETDNLHYTEKSEAQPAD